MNLLKHCTDDCKKLEKKCTVRGCQKFIKPAEFDNHVKTCEYRIATCKNCYVSDTLKNLHKTKDACIKNLQVALKKSKKEGKALREENKSKYEEVENLRNRIVE